MCRWVGCPHASASPTFPLYASLAPAAVSGFWWCQQLFVVGAFVSSPYLLQMCASQGAISTEQAVPVRGLPSPLPTHTHIPQAPHPSVGEPRGSVRVESSSDVSFLNCTFVHIGTPYAVSVMQVRVHAGSGCWRMAATLHHTGRGRKLASLLSFAAFRCRALSLLFDPALYRPLCGYCSPPTVCR